MIPQLLAPTALVLGLVSAPLPPVPLGAEAEPVVPDVSAESWMLYDATHEVVLAQQRANEERPMASVTKVMSSLVALESVDPAEVVTIPAFATGTRGSTVGLVAGEEWSVMSLLVAMMVRSGNDAALAISNHVAGSVDGFVDMMNARATEMGLHQTSFANPSGLDAENHYSTAADLVRLAVVAIDDPVIGRLARIRVVKFPDDPTGRSRRAANTNRLLGVYPGVSGLKTGDTAWAGKVLISIAEQGPRTLVAVVMGSDDHFTDARELLEYGFRTFGVRDRMLRPFVGEQGGGGTPATDVALPETMTERLAALSRLDGGRWAMSSLADLPKGEALGEWLKEALPETLGGS